MEKNNEANADISGDVEWNKHMLKTLQDHLFETFQ